MVVQTRSKRKQISYCTADSDQDEELALALALADSKAARNPKSKKARKSPTKPPFEMIPDELLPHILSYLDNVRQVYHLSTLNKSLRKVISPELVITTAKFSGGPYSTALRSLMFAISDELIRAPSTLRLLRLINAKSCERGKECFCYNLDTQKSGPLIADNIRPFGMAICSPCLHALSSKLGDDCSDSLRSGGICTHGRSRVLCYPQVEQATGEAVGPIVLFRDITQIQYSYSDNSKRDEVLKSTIASKREQVHGPEDSARIDRFCVAYSDAVDQYEAHCEAKRRIAKDKREQQAAKRIAKKQRLTGVVLQKLESHFAGFQHDSLVLNRYWCDIIGTYRFHHWPSSITFHRLMEAPSSATQKKIREAATRAKLLYTTLEECGFLGDFFPYQLQEWLNANADAPIHEKALVRYFAECKESSLAILPSIRDLFSMKLDNIHQATIEGNRAKIVLCLLEAEECRDAFAHEVTWATTQNSSRKKRYQLAKHVWTIHNTPSWNREYLSGFYELNEYGQKFDEVHHEYNNILRKIIQYKNHSVTKAWIKHILGHGNFSQSLTPMDAIDTLYEGDFGAAGKNGSFDDWRRHHASLVRTAYQSERDV